MQANKSGLHLLFPANIQTQLPTNLVSRIRRRAVKTRKVTTEWNDTRNIGPHLNADAAGTKP